MSARFAIAEDIEQQYRVGLFAYPGRVHDAWIRFSNAAVLREDDLKAGRDGDRKNGSRGMAVKVMDVKGDVLDLDNGRRNQDFLMVNTPEFALANARDYLRLDRILARDPMGADPTAYFIPAVLAQIGEPKDGEPAEITAKRDALKTIAENHPLLNELTAVDLMGTISSAKVAAKIGRTVVRNPSEVQYFGAAPFLFGSDRAMKFSAKPRKPVEQQPFAEITDDDPPPDYLRDALGTTIEGDDDIVFDFMIQTQTAGASGLGIEDATTIWQDELESYVAVAKITIPSPQTPHTPEEQTICEKLFFTPWHALAAHRPIGGINRLRRNVYAASAGHRGADGY